MDSLILLSFRIALLVLLWFFVLMAINAMRRDANAAAGVTGRRGRKNKSAAVATPAVPPPPPRKRGEQARELTIVEGPLKGSHMEITALDEVVLGRSPDCTFVVGDDYASGRHARLFRRGNDWFVEDLDSRNGTFVGGYRIDQPESVTVGSDIKVGRTTVRLIP
ncbi:FHA domain-containing protein FhaB/FipA [Corynebacterium halotolerans]|uniref:FHA domain-containing protein FhaB/FipA n=1 Tax=Corynebacterium halotolerans TaxID=225326 RepID=UPI003CFA95E5